VADEGDDDGSAEKSGGDQKIVPVANEISEHDSADLDAGSGLGRCRWENDESFLYLKNLYIETL
jgi:hypothetical protein